MANPSTFAGERAFLRGGGAIAELVAAHDWASTPLGPLESWPVALKAAVTMVLGSSMPMALILGPDAIALYNDAYAPLIGSFHPKILGSRCRDTWPGLARLADDTMAAAERGERLSFRDLELIAVGRDGPEHIWMNIDASPLRDEDGEIFGVLSVNLETTERVQAERAASAEVDYLRRLADQAPGFVCFTGGPPDFVVEYVNETYKELFGAHAEGRRLLETMPLTGKGAPVEAALAHLQGERYVGRGDRILLTRPDDSVEELFVDLVLQPVKDDEGRVSGVYVEGFDVTPLVRAQRVAEETARRLSAAATVARLGTFELDSGPEGLVAKLDARAREILGFGPDEVVTVQDMRDRIHPEDLQRMEADDRRAVAAGETRREAESRVRLPGGAVRRVRGAGDLCVLPDGTPVWYVGMLEDVTERRRAEQRQRLLVNELNHRVKNTLATVQAIAAQTLRFAPDLPQARAAFEARLVALSTAHDLLTAETWRGARLDEVAASALAPFEAVQRPQIARSGPPVWLTAPPALALSIALHELATNATKHGALTVPEGRVRLAWRLESDELVLDWVELGGPRVDLPSRSGFGLRLLRRNLARELNGEVAVEFAPEGLRCEIRFPLDEREAGKIDASRQEKRASTPDAELRRSISG